MKHRTYTHPVTRSSVKRRTRRRGMGDLGMNIDVRKGLTASVDAVKSVGMVALVAAGGAAATDYVFKNLIGEDKDKPGFNILGIEIGSTTEQIAKAVFGLVGGVVIGKMGKKPQLGAAFAIGAVAIAIYNIINKELINKPVTQVKGLGYTRIDRADSFKPAALGMGAVRIADPNAFQSMPTPMAGYGSY